MAPELEQNSGPLNTSSLFSSLQEGARLGQGAKENPPWILTTPLQWGRWQRRKQMLLWWLLLHVALPTAFFVGTLSQVVSLSFWIGLRSKYVELTLAKSDSYPERRQNRISARVHHQCLPTPDLPVKEASVHILMCFPFFIPVTTSPSIPNPVHISTFASVMLPLHQIFLALVQIPCPALEDLSFHYWPIRY
jgi:hypothetical protein